VAQQQEAAADTAVVVVEDTQDHEQGGYQFGLRDEVVLVDMPQHRLGLVLGPEEDHIDYVAAV
jgi:hypothetical protein